jgi:hypothetical protein
MKGITTTVIFALLFASAAFAREQTVLARVTVYWRGEGQMRASWNGARLREGHCAVDPSKIPFGSKVVFADGAECKAVDSGPAVVSRLAARSAGHNPAQRNAIVVDRFFETKEQAMAWSDAHPHFMTLRVVEPGADKKPLPERDTMLAQAIEKSTAAAQTVVAAIRAPSGLQTADATAVALLPLIPLLRFVRRRMARVRPRLCYAYA